LKTDLFRVNGVVRRDPSRLLQGVRKFMRPVKLRPGTPANVDALNRLIAAAYSDIKARVENG